MRKLTMESSSSSNDCSTDPPISTVTTGVEVGVISAYDIVEEDRRSPSPVLSMRKFDFKQLPPTEVGVDMLLNRDPVVTPIITDATEGMEFRAPIGSTDFIDLFSSGFLTSTGPTVEPPLVNLDHDIKEKPHDWDPNAPLPPQRGTSFRPLIQLPTTYSNTYSVHPQPPSTRPISDSGIAPPLTPPLSAGNEKTVSTRSEAVHSRTSTFAAAGGQYLRFRDHPWTWTVRQVAEYLVRLGHPTPLVKTFIGEFSFPSDLNIITV
ncbi:hypothetical protein BC829DRAFT_113964 [Chytridium lagenaria]|nr:hypothetical protein BC829DRAFT_113964 [Chytridium lagenaria]